MYKSAPGRSFQVDAAEYPFKDHWLMGGWPLGYWLQTRRNFFATSIVPRGIFHKEKIVASLRTQNHRGITDPKEA
jgi:hypothetical protein